MSDDRRSDTGAAAPGGGLRDENAEPYIIAPRDARDEAQRQDLQRCREAIERSPSAQVSEARGLLKARLPSPLAQQLRREFADRLVIEKDSPLPDPRVKPDLKF